LFVSITLTDIVYSRFYRQSGANLIVIPSDIKLANYGIPFMSTVRTIFAASFWLSMI